MTAMMLVNAWIILLIVVAWCWNFPEDYVFRKIIQPLKGVILYTGLWHGWNMFAPEPILVNRTLEATIHLAGGKTIAWEADDTGRMPWWRAFLFVRERKLIDNLLSNQFAYLRPAMADFLARQFQSQGHDVVKVELVQLRRPVPPPDKWREVGEFERKVIWTYLVPKSKSPESGTAADKIVGGNGKDRPVQPSNTFVAVHDRPEPLVQEHLS